MAVTLAEIDNRVVRYLGDAVDFITLDDVHNATVQALNLRTMQTRSSDINVLLSVTDPFEPVALVTDVTALIGKARPAWLEIAYQGVGIGDGIWWTPVRNINLSQLNDYQRAGSFACSFVIDEPAGPNPVITTHLHLTFLPINRTMRIRFDRDAHQLDMNDEIMFPDNLSELVVMDAFEMVAPSVKMQLASRLRNDPKLQEYGAAVVGALDSRIAYNQNVKPNLEAMWKIWAFRDRSAETSFDKPTPTSSGAYPGGGRGDWGGYGTGYGNG